MIESNRLSLRELTLADVSSRYEAWMNDAETVRFMESRFTQHTQQSLKAFVVGVLADKSSHLLAIVLKENGQHIGNLKVGPIDVHHAYASLGLMIGEKECWGKGYGSEAIAIVCDWAFSELGLNKITAGAYATNVGSIRAFEKVGFECEGILRDQYLDQGVYVDVHLFGLLTSHGERNG